MFGPGGAGRHHRAGGDDLYIWCGMQREGDRALGATEAAAGPVAVLGSGRSVSPVTVVVRRRRVLGRHRVVMGALPPAGGGSLHGEQERNREYRTERAHQTEYYTGFGGR